MPSASKDDLLKRKQDLLRKQKRVCEEMNELLTRDETGLNEVSRMTKRSLEVAIVLSKRPGAIDYYEQPEETQTIVRNNDLKNLSKRVDRIQGEIDSVDAELEQIEDFIDWFAAFPHRHKLLIAGNHDVTLHPEYYEQHWQRYQRVRL